ncbi:ABC efflux pump, inner membrane subunit [Candidatus Koribacter versatilis Ellin345]|uniref:ABC efflux pump, inner membrane subunit n=1 Tax=Koribacter versatilis (strain Ellin345) TaxID=204669 RepID=Q1IM58_KORVE|nr:ABC transporter permease [Candidatus Koribacter versatilis]ABF42042.1 ABC efflux pump, inner membrane subunit [Candidatus Koribacter versatilis Ellin345]
MHDVRLAFRQFLKSPGFVFTVVLTIALGIGANTAIFTLVHAVLLKSLPVVDPNTLYRIGDKDDCCVNGGFMGDDGDFDLFSYDLYTSLRDNTPEFEQLAAMQSGGNEMSVRRGSALGKALRTEYVSGNYFTTFGIVPYTGRLMTMSDDVTGAAPAVVMSYTTWQNDYAGDPSLVGSTLYLQGKPVTVIGIAPPGFYGDRLRSSPPALWIPLAIEPVLEGNTSILHVRESNWLYAIGRLKPGVQIGPLQAKVSNTLRVWLSGVEMYTRNGGKEVIPKQHVVIVPAGGGIQNMQQETGKGLYLLMAISALVLLVACANVANLLLARGATRRTEISIRMAMGAARKRLIRSMLVESVLLAFMAGLVGLVVAYAGTRTILSLAFPDSPQLPIHATPSLPVLGFALLLSLGTGVIFGIVPAWITSHSDPADALRGTSRTTKDGASMPQKWLIVFQAALSLALLVSAGLMTKSLRNLQHQDFGLKTDNRYVVHFDLMGAGYTPTTLQPLYQRLEERFGSIPGVDGVGIALYSTLEGNNWGEGIRIEGRPEPGPQEDNGSSWDRVNPQFFKMMGQPILRGRGLQESDTPTSQFVAVVNEAFVKKFFPKEEPIGKHFGVFDMKYSGAFEIVGVVKDAKYQDPHQKMRAMYFRPLTQELKVEEPNAKMAEGRSLYANSITLHFSQPPSNVDELVRRTLADIDPNITINSLHSLEFQIGDNLTQERLISRLTMLFGALALILASVGLYGITSYAVARRTGEIGLRMALGADRGNVVRLVLRGVAVRVGLGLAIGIPLTLIGGHYMADQLYNVKAWDPASLAIGIAVLSAAALVAGFIPARRAASIEPMQALRIE